MKRVVIAVVVLAVALAGLIGWKIYSQNQALLGPAGGSGVVESEGIDVSSRLGARISSIEVEEGAHVERGAVIATLECDEPTARLNEAQARLRAAQAQAEAGRAQAEAARRSSSAAHAAATATRAQLEVLGTQQGVAEREAQRVESMGEHISASRADQARAQAEGLEAQNRVARAQGTANARQASASEAQAQAAEAQAIAAEQSAAAIEAMVRSAELAVAECRIVAPRDGIVERIYFDPGELVMPGSTVARVIDSRFVRATFYLPNAELGHARVGMHAVVAADAYPDRTFQGEVRRIGMEAEFTPRNVQTRTDRDRLVYPVEVRIPNTQGSLRAGMPVQVTLQSQ